VPRWGGWGWAVGGDARQSTLPTFPYLVYLLDMRGQAMPVPCR
jgi:hypothetical protein